MNYPDFKGQKYKSSSIFMSCIADVLACFELPGPGGGSSLFLLKLDEMPVH
jgi:hypothetical protein